MTEHRRLPEAKRRDAASGAEPSIILAPITLSLAFPPPSGYHVPMQTLSTNLSCALTSKASAATSCVLGISAHQLKGAPTLPGMRHPAALL